MVWVRFIPFGSTLQFLVVPLPTCVTTWASSESPNDREKDNPGYMGVSKNKVPKNGWFIMDNPIKMMDDLGVPLCSETSIFICLEN